jgi:hypothetical protein
VECSFHSSRVPASRVDLRVGEKVCHLPQRLCDFLRILSLRMSLNVARERRKFCHYAFRVRRLYREFAPQRSMGLIGIG